VVAGWDPTIGVVDVAPAAAAVAGTNNSTANDRTARFSAPLIKWK
jgi:hypothetical protein